MDIYRAAERGGKYPLRKGGKYPLRVFSSIFV